MDSFHHGHALVVGISRYAFTSTLSINVHTDAVDFAQVLKSHEFCGYPERNIELLTEASATAAAFEEGMAALADRAGADATAVVFFSGHGARLQNPDGTWSSYLVFHDSRLAERTALVSGEMFSELLRRIPARRILVLLDSCYAGGAARIKALPGNGAAGLDRNFLELLSGEGRVVLASSCEDQVSRIDPHERNSRFTKLILEGLRGAAGAPEDSVVTVMGLFNFVKSKMKDLEPIQEPLFLGSMKEDFPVALRHPAKAAPPEIQRAEVAEPFRANQEVYVAGNDIKQIRGNVIGDVHF